MQLDLPVSADLQHWMDTRVSRSGYRDTADYLRQLIERDRTQYEADIAHVRRLVQEGIDSGTCDESPEQILQGIRAKYLHQHG